MYDVQQHSCYINIAITNRDVQTDDIIDSEACMTALLKYFAAWAEVTAYTVLKDLHSHFFPYIV